jgi:hypothetical protein
MARPPKYPADHPLASDYMREKYLTQPIPEFTKATFKSYLVRNSMRFQDGNLYLSLMVPEDDVDDALELRSIEKQHVPLTVTVEVESAFLEALGG